LAKVLGTAAVLVVALRMGWGSEAATALLYAGHSALYTPGSDGTYSQNYQDLWVVALAKANGWDSPGAGGFFLDVGAFNGIWCSNTVLLEEVLDWNGVCVEPYPRDFEGRRCALVQKAIGSTAGKIVSMTGSMQTRTVVEEAGGDIETTSFEALLGEFRPDGGLVHFMSLDVEGFELAALSTFPWERWTVGAFIVESPSPETKRLLFDHGYRQRSAVAAGPTVDGYFVRDEFWPADGVPARDSRVHPTFSWGC